VQTAVLQRATQFITTCGGLAWLAPFMGVDTLAVYASDELLGPHLYAAREAYRVTGAAPFVPLDLAALASVRERTATHSSGVAGGDARP
jgi:hypothetical protein